MNPLPEIILSDDFLDLGALAGTLSQVVKFRSSYFTVTDNFDLLYIGRVKRPCLLDADTVGSFSYGECLTVSAALSL